jgi:hypothetical protein
MPRQCHGAHGRKVWSLSLTRSRRYSPPMKDALLLVLAVVWTVGWASRALVEAGRTTARGGRCTPAFSSSPELRGWLTAYVAFVSGALQPARSRVIASGVREDAPMSKEPKADPLERRARRASSAVEGVYGVDARDAGAASWTGRYLMWARTPDEAKERLTAAGFHNEADRAAVDTYRAAARRTARWPRERCLGWFRSRFEDEGWTDWEALGAGYRHPPQGARCPRPLGAVGAGRVGAGCDTVSLALAGLAASFL